MTNQPGRPEQLDTYIRRYCDELLLPEELAQLERWLASDDEYLAQFLLHLEIHSALAWQTRASSEFDGTSHAGPHQSPDDELSTTQNPADSPPAKTDAAKRGSASPAFPSFISDYLPSVHPIQFVIAAILISLTAWWALGFRNGGAPIAENLAADRPDAKAPSGQAAVARLESGTSCQWGAAAPAVAVGEALMAGQKIELLTGSARFRFLSDAIVAVEGPATMELVSANSLRLESGTLTVRADGPTKDFAVICPDASIVDLGTSFGVHYEAGKPTEVEVFEGAVKVIPDVSLATGRVLGLGSFSRVVRHGQEVSVDDAEPKADRFGDLLELLWAGRSLRQTESIDLGEGDFVEARFDDPPLPEAVDTFYGAAPGRGWLTSWMAAGNPVGEIRRDNPLSGVENARLRLQFTHARERTIAREYGPRNGFDPSRPHVVSWKWRYEGKPEHFAGDYNDRVHFFSNASFRRGTMATNSWLIGLCSAGRGGDDPRSVFPGRWYFFDRSESGERGEEFHRRNMVDTEMVFKPGVVYHFAVVVYPDQARYDAAIRDDEQTFIRTGMTFRNGSPGPANMLHFGLHTSNANDHAGFSLDSLRIEPWTGDEQVLQRLVQPDVVASSASPLPPETDHPVSADGYSGIWYPSYRRNDDYGYKYAGGLGTFPQQHVPLAVYSKEANKTFFVYGGSSNNNELLHMVSYFDHATGKLARPRILDNKRTGDANDCPTLTIDPDGHLWIFANSHGLLRSAFVWRSVEPYSIESFERVAATNFSFAQPWRLPSGETILLHTRYGEEHAKSLYQMRSRDGKNWSLPELLATAQKGHYQVSWQQGDRIGTILNFHPTKGGLDARTNLYYLETLDGGKTWQNAQGGELNLPLVSEKNAALVENYQRMKQLVYLKDLAFTAEGQPVALYLTSYGHEPGPNNGPRQFTTARWDGSAWKIRRVTSTDHNYDHASLYIEDDGTWRMIGTTGAGPQPYQTGGEVEMWQSRDQGRTWELEKQLTHDSQFNHYYPRRPVNAHSDFYAFWADGHAREPSPSRLFFCTQDGRVYQMPEKIDDNQTEISPQPLFQ